ncbi:MAG: hypothetical protein FJ276_12365, partial [Planctomycetes bacterium]|nr:hypothetical protein [Planctomycetota bacterium]
MRALMAIGVIGLVCPNVAQAGEPITLFDFTQGTHGWVAAHAVENLRSTSEGLEFDCVGDDPYIWCGPVSQLPLGCRVTLTIRMRSDADPSGQVFYGRQFSAGNAVSFTVRDDGRWHEYEVLLPPQEAGGRLRIDPAGGKGRIAIAWIRATAIRPLLPPDVTPPRIADLGTAPATVQAGDLVVAHGGRQWDQYALRVAGQEMAQSHARLRLGVLVDGEPTYVEYGGAPCQLTRDADGRMRVIARMLDAAGGRWELSREFAPRDDGAISVQTRITVDRARDIFHLPMITLVAGLGTFGEEKTQAVLPGVEYLENEPSSSEADVRGAQAVRRMVDPYKLCFPMMSLVANGRYVGLAWERQDGLAPLFDSPDRVFGSGGHVLGLWLPGVGDGRLENELAAYRPFPLAAHAPLTSTVTLFGGRGESIAPAVAQYVRLRGGLPPVPEFTGGFEGAVRLLAHGWLDSAGHQDGTWRHAVWGTSFPAQPAADAPGYMLWLAEHAHDVALAERLRAGAARGLERLSPASSWEARVAHVARPFAPLLFGQIEPYAQRRLAAATQALRAFDAQGLVRYRARPSGPDYGSTHWEDHANGLSAAQLEPMLETAVFTGDQALSQAALELLDKQLNTYRNTVPRGAQTWEIPLHTPDILGSGRILSCCNLAYLLTADPKYLEAARYWAWTGASMVYLDPPTSGPVGLYATTAVLGATNWVAPFWIGLPVQWCGLVYRSALQDLARLDPEMGPLWQQLASGITRSGLQQTFPIEDQERQGLLPDFFHLKAQQSDGPAISPGTVQANLAEAYGKTP